LLGVGSESVRGQKVFARAAGERQRSIPSTYQNIRNSISGSVRFDEVEKTDGIASGTCKFMVPQSIWFALRT
jgi:hypothetical protein